MVLGNSLLFDKKDIKSETLKDNIMDLGQKTFYIPNTYLYRAVNTDESVGARPDLVSKRIYGTDIYGDVIAKLNGYGNPLEFPEDDVVIIPEVSDVSRFFWLGEDPIEEKYTPAPKPKKKNEQRKASDAMVGDTRYRIDSTNKIVIY